jgi:hypothetical protein
MKVIDDLVVQVYASCDVVGIDAATGNPLWAAATKTHSEELVGVGDHILLGGTTTIDPKTGEVSDGDAEARATVLDGWALRGLSPVDRTLSITDLETGRTRELKAPWADDPELEPPSAPPDTQTVMMTSSTSLTVASVASTPLICVRVNGCGQVISRSPAWTRWARLRGQAPCLWRARSIQLVALEWCRLSRSTAA